METNGMTNPEVDAFALINRSRNWVLLQADTLFLFVPQEDISSIDHLSETPVTQASHGLLHIPSNDDNIIYIAPSAQLQPLSSCPKNRFLSTRLNSMRTHEFHWCWNQVKLMNDTQIQFQEIPTVIRQPLSHFKYFTPYDDTLAYFTTAKDLRQAMISLMSSAHMNTQNNTQVSDGVIRRGV